MLHLRPDKRKQSRCTTAQQSPPGPREGDTPRNQRLGTHQAGRCDHDHHNYNPPQTKETDSQTACRPTKSLVKAHLRMAVNKLQGTQISLTKGIQRPYQRKGITVAESIGPARPTLRETTPENQQPARLTDGLTPLISGFCCEHVARLEAYRVTRIRYFHHRVSCGGTRRSRWRVTVAEAPDRPVRRSAAGRDFHNRT